MSSALAWQPNAYRGQVGPGGVSITGTTGKADQVIDFPTAPPAHIRALDDTLAIIVSAQSGTGPTAHPALHADVAARVTSAPAIAYQAALQTAANVRQRSLLDFLR